jgi:hypothetical protein
MFNEIDLLDINKWCSIMVYMIYRYASSILNIFLKLLELLPREFKNTELNYEVVYLWKAKINVIYIDNIIGFIDHCNFSYYF